MCARVREKVEGRRAEEFPYQLNSISQHGVQQQIQRVKRKEEQQQIIRFYLYVKRRHQTVVQRE